MNHRFVAVTPAYAAAVGMVPRTLMGRMDAEFIPDHMVGLFRADDLLAAEKQRPIHAFAPGFSGSVGFITTKRPVRQNGRLLGVAGIARPWSEESIRAALGVPGPRASGTPAWLEEARRLIVDRFRLGLLVRDVAAELGVHPDYLTRQFRHAFGINVSALIRKLRVAWSMAELSNSRCSLSTVSLEAGFFDQSHFTRAFCREAGRPPGAFRSRFA